MLDGKQVTLYLDRFADNAPVRGAQIELDIAGAKFKAEASKGQQGEDTYQVTLKDAPKPGVLPITATVTAGSEVDLLAGELDLHEEAHTGEPVHAHSWKELAGGPQVAWWPWQSWCLVAAVWCRPASSALEVQHDARSDAPPPLGSAWCWHWPAR